MSIPERPRPDIIRTLAIDYGRLSLHLRAILRAPLRVRPADLPEGESVECQLVRHAGRAEHLAARKQFEESLREYERLTVDFPKTRNVEYALGRYFVDIGQPLKVVAAFLRDIENSRDHVPAHLGIAAIKAVTDPAAAHEYAEDAVMINPHIPLGHYLFGKLLLRTSQISRATSELEIAERFVRDDPGVYYALGRAYARAGRTQDAARARATFRRLTEERQRAAENTCSFRRTPASEPATAA